MDLSLNKPGLSMPYIHQDDGKVAHGLEAGRYLFGLTEDGSRSLFGGIEVRKVDDLLSRVDSLIRFAEVEALMRVQALAKETEVA